MKMNENHIINIDPIEKWYKRISIILIILIIIFYGYIIVYDSYYREDFYKKNHLNECNIILKFPIIKYNSSNFKIKKKQKEIVYQEVYVEEILEQIDDTTWMDISNGRKIILK